MQAGGNPLGAAAAAPAAAEVTMQTVCTKIGESVIENVLALEKRHKEQLLQKDNELGQMRVVLAEANNKALAHKKLEEQGVRLQKEMDELKQTIEQAGQEKTNLQQELEAKKKQAEQLQQGLDKAIQERDDKNTQLRRVKQQLQIAETEAEEAQTQLQQAKTELQQAKQWQKKEINEKVRHCMRAVYCTRPTRRTSDISHSHYTHRCKSASSCS